MSKAMDPSFMNEWFVGWEKLPMTMYSEYVTLSLANRKQAKAAMDCLRMNFDSFTYRETYMKHLVICILLGHLRYAYQITKPLTFDDLPNLEEEFEAARKWSVALYMEEKLIKSLCDESPYTDQGLVDLGIYNRFEEVNGMKTSSTAGL